MDKFYIKNGKYYIKSDKYDIEVSKEIQRKCRSAYDSYKYFDDKFDSVELVYLDDDTFYHIDFRGENLPEECLLKKYDVKILLDKLSDTDKQIAVLSIYGFSEREIGEVLGLSKQAINKRKNKIKLILSK